MYTVHQLLEAEEQSGTPTNRIVLGGFSQGGALAIYSALTYPRQLGETIASQWICSIMYFIQNS